jgi:hypothetical protein
MNETPCEMCGTVNRVEAPRQREAKNTFVLWLVKPLGRFTQGLTLVACAFYSVGDGVALGCGVSLLAFARSDVVGGASHLGGFD